MKPYSINFAHLGYRWAFQSVWVSCVLMGVVQVVFMGIQSQIAEKAEIAGRSVINSSNRSLNPYYFSQAVSGLELGAMLSCVRIKKLGQEIPFYESTPEYCPNTNVPRAMLGGEERTAIVKSASGAWMTLRSG